jgi:VWFA-related protein
MNNVIRLSFLCACLTAVAVQAQQPPAPPTGQAPPTFRVEVNYVEVDARVTDARGNPVADLTAADFEVLEDGKPQKISNFSPVNIPIVRAERPLFASAPIEADVQSNARANGRVYLIVLDDLHIHPLRTSRVKAAVRRFIEQHFGTNDLAAVVFTSGRGDAGQEFTNNRRLLLAAVDRFMGAKIRSPTLDRLEQYRRDQGMRSAEEAARRVSDPNVMERGLKARNALDSVKNLAEFLAGVRGRRKALLFISEGIDYEIHDPFNNPDATAIIDASRDAIGAATRANVSIYSIDPRGLTSMGEEGIEVDSFPEDPAYGIGPMSMLDELRISQDSLRTLSEETGGFAAVNRNDFGGAFERVVTENSTYYMLGYYPSNDRRDGRFRKIEVRVRRPGLQVRSRKGYVAPRGRAPATGKATDTPNASAAMRDAMNSPLPISAVRMTVFAAPFKGTAPNATIAIAVELAAGEFKYVEKDGALASDLELAFVAVDTKGKLHSGDRNTINLALKPETFARVKSNGFRVTSQMDLPPGRYQLRVASAESGGRSGSVLYDLEVPDFYKTPLTMSGLAMTAASAGQTPTARSKDPLRDFLPGPPTAAREFQRGDELALFAEVYENAAGSAAHKVDITTTVRADDGRVVLQNQEERASTELKGGRGGYGFTTRIPLKDFAPGTYVIHVEAKSRTAPDKPVSRDVQIRVR